LFFRQIVQLNVLNTLIDFRTNLHNFRSPLLFYEKPCGNLKKCFGIAKVS
jgi:hypothetical protein